MLLLLPDRLIQSLDIHEKILGVQLRRLLERSELGASLFRTLSHQGKDTHTADRSSRALERIRTRSPEPSSSWTRYQSPHQS